ncbi:MAG TPA: hypothetical protein VKH81_10015 [Candidatus Angelobacter sp.]|nr:hypothetical protein [Candidatus Angelobacter sp.]
MSLNRILIRCKFLAALCLCAAAMSEAASAQVWVASTGTVDPSSLSSTLFQGQLVFIKPGLATGTVTLRYNVLPVDDLTTVLTQPCCQSRELVVRYMDNGPGAQVLVKLKRYNVNTGAVTTLLTFNSKDFPSQTAFQQPLPGPMSFFNFSFADGPINGVSDQGGDSVYYIEATLIRSASGGNPGLGSIRLVTALAP